MSPAEVQATDPSHRMLLASAFVTVLRASFSRQSVLGSVTGSFLGFCNDSNWALVQRDRAVAATVFSAHGSDSSSAAGRVSYLFGLKGPCLSVNTACSSSLVALDSGFANLRLDKCTAALVAGVNLQLHVASWIGLGKLNALAEDGQCKTFDRRANGFGRSEACGAVLLVSRAAQSSVAIQGCAVNQDGRSASFMAPNGPSQVEVIV